MKYALNPEGTRVEATPRAHGTCPGCSADLIAKCGHLVAHHWAHRAGPDCDSWWESEGPWHRAWKAHAPPERQEVTIDRNGVRHRADLVLSDGTVVELQHSQISIDDVRAREAHYGRMIWIVDASDAFAKGRITDECDVTEAGDTQVRWVSPKRWWTECRSPVYLDLGSDRVLHVTCVEYADYFPARVLAAPEMHAIIQSPHDADAITERDALFEREFLEWGQDPRYYSWIPQSDPRRKWVLMRRFAKTIWNRSFCEPLLPQRGNSTTKATAWGEAWEAWGEAWEESWSIERTRQEISVFFALRAGKAIEAEIEAAKLVEAERRERLEAESKRREAELAGNAAYQEAQAARAAWVQGARARSEEYERKEKAQRDEWARQRAARGTVMVSEKELRERAILDAICQELDE